MKFRIYKTLPLREAAVESIGFMAKYLFNRVQASPMVHVQLAITQLLQVSNTSIWHGNEKG